MHLVSGSLEEPIAESGAGDSRAHPEDEVLPVKDEVLPVKDEVSPVKDEVSPVKDEVSPVKDEVCKHVREL